MQDKIIYQPKGMADFIEGRNPVTEALKSGRAIHKIMISRVIGQHSAVDEMLNLARDRGIPVEQVTKEALDRLSRTGAHQGVMAAVAAARRYITLDELMAVSKQKNELPLYCILDGIEDPYNLGAIIRTAEASGIHGIVIRSRREVGITAVVAKASAGAVEYVPVAMVSNISQAIEKLKKNNVWVIGVDAAGEIDYSKADFKVPAAIVIGGEGKGLSDLVKKHCDYLAFIPMVGKISSLNASIAAGLVMYEALRQRSG